MQERAIQAVAPMTAPVEATTWPANRRYGNPLILGKSLGEWHAGWFRWRDRLTQRFGDPALESGPVDCSLGQNGQLWYLAGCSVSDPSQTTCKLTRTHCRIPSNKWIGVPLLNVSFVNFVTAGENFSVPEKRAILGWYLGTACRLEGTLDGKNFAEFFTVARNQTPAFALNFTEPDNTPGFDPKAVGDGYFAVLPPLPVGKHTLRIRGAQCDEATGGVFFESDVTYENLQVR